MANNKEEPVAEEIGEEVLTSEEALAKVAMILARTDNPKLLSELNLYEISSVAVIQSVADETKNRILQEFIKNFLYFRVSSGRKGRKELMEIATAIKQEPEKGMMKVRKLLGWGGRG